MHRTARKRASAASGEIVAGLILALAVSCGCLGSSRPPEGIAPAQAGSGPQVVFDPLADPMPEVPFPNDLVTVLDPSLPTGRRLNVRIHAATHLESGIRDRMDRLDGFGTYAPITVRFSARLDIRNIQNRHRPDYDFSDDAVFLVNLNPASRHYGEPVPLDLGIGNFPLGLPAAHNWRFGEVEDSKRNYLYFKNDYRELSSNLLLETEEEDLDCNGMLDPGEDTDFDGLLDHPNLADPKQYNPGCWPDQDPPKTLDVFARYNDIVTFYEFETDTLIIRPIVPLEQASEYAVILTNRLVGEDGQPVRSPFPYVNHSSQTERLRPLIEIVEHHKDRFGIDPEDIAFAWTFTTQSVTRDLETIRDGLHGKGTMAWLGQAFPPEIQSVVGSGKPSLGDGNPYIVKIKNFQLPFLIIGFFSLGDLDMVAALLDTYRYVDYLVSGTFISPYFLNNDEGVFEIDPLTGTAQVTGDRVTFWLVVPKRRADYPGPVPAGYPEDTRPFPVTFYGHGYTTARTEALGFAGLMAKFGIATIGMDAPGHGPLDTLADIPNELRRMARETFGTDTLDQGVRDLLEDLLPSPLADALYRFLQGTLVNILVQVDPCMNGPEDLPRCVEPPLILDNIAIAAVNAPLIRYGFRDGRAVDLTGDGVSDSGADFWTARTFHTRDIVRQGVIDHLQMVRIMETFDGRRLWDIDINGNGIRDDLAGDFNGDGVPDIGGSRDMGEGWGRYYTWGQSLGGFFSSIHAAIDPSIEAAAPVSAGAGLTDIGLRSIQDGVFQAVFLELLGPMVVGGYGRDILADDYDPKKAGYSEADLDSFWLAFDTLLGNKEKVIPIATIDPLMPGDRVELLNLANGEKGKGGGVRRFADGHIGFRASVAADFGDPLEITIRGADGRIKEQRVASCPTARGYGHMRGSPDLRRFMGLAQMILAPGDPASYAPHLIFEPLPGMHPKNVLFVHSVGDPVVPIATGVGKARCAGILGWQGPDQGHPYSVSLNQYLIDHYVTEGLKHVGRYGTWEDPLLFDPDNLSNGTDGLRAERPPRGEELRARYVRRAETGEIVGMSGIRFPFTDYKNSDLHGVDPPLPRLDFDVGTFVTNQIGVFFASDGTCITDDPCLADVDMKGCEWFWAGLRPDECR